MALISRQILLSLVVAGAMLACGGETNDPSSGSLSVTVIGLPGGSAAAVTVTGPGGYNQAVTTSQTLAPISSGTYTITASDVIVGGTTYAGSPASQSVTVGSSASATVTYSASSSGGSRLFVNINGLQSSSPAAVTVTGPGFSQTVTSTQTLTGLAAGTYTIAAQDVTVGGTPYTASPATQDAAVTTTGTATATITYGAPPSGAFNLRIDGMYLTQSTQTYDGAVPLVQGRSGYLRVFVVANQLNASNPSVRVRFFQDLVLQSEQTITAPGVSVPSAPDESSLSYSWNIPVSGAVIRPGLSITAEVDVANTVSESDEMDNAYPAAAPQSLTVRTTPTLNMTFVPIRQRGNGSTATVSNPSSYLEMIQKMHPIATINTAVHAIYTTTTSDTLEDDNGNSAWGTILGEIEFLRATEQSSRYYYGVANVSYTSGVAGVAYVSTPTISARASMGWDYIPSGAVVAAHELAHNWGRNHAPCGDPGGVDTQYPHPDGSVGVYGLDVATQTLKPPTTLDIMGYCDPKWIGDYTYKAVLNYLSPPSPVFTSAMVNDAVQPTLMVWGHIRDGKMVLEPAFQVNTRPKLPQRPGPYSIEARAADGTTLLNLSFQADEVADAPGRHKNFVFAVPLPSSAVARIATLRLHGQGQQAVVSTAAAGESAGAQLNVGAKPDSVEVRRVGGGRVGLRWNARALPMVMVRDAATGEVLSLARGGDVELPGIKGEVELVMSDGVRSRVKRLPAR